VTATTKESCRCQQLLPKTSSDTQSLCHPKTGHWCSQWWKFCAVAETYIHYPLQDAISVAN